MTGNSDSHINSLKTENVIFQDCVFLYVEFNEEFLGRAKFINCIFIRCWIKDVMGLDNLKGSRGFFQYIKEGHRPKSRVVEYQDRPSLWTAKRAERALINFKKLNSSSHNTDMSDRSRFLEDLGLEDVLAMVFPQHRSRSWKDITITEIRSILRKIDQDRESLAKQLLGQSEDLRM